MLCAKVKAALSTETIFVKETVLSYIECLMPKYRSRKTLVLYRQSPVSDNLQEKSIKLDVSETSILDVTGSPLVCELGYSCVDETIIDDHRNWKKEEELHLPLTKSEACATLNRCLEYVSDSKWSEPLLALCDGTDNRRTIVLGTYVEDGWYTTMQVLVADAESLQNIEALPAALLRQYCDVYSLPEHKVSVTVSGTYELYGKRPGIMDVSGALEGRFNGSLNIEVNWNTLLFRCPIRASTSTLIIEMFAEWSSGHLQNLWKELTLLYEYLNKLHGNSKKSARLFVYPNHIPSDDVIRKLNLLLDGDNESYKPFKEGNEDNHRHVTDDIKLQTHVDQVQFRPNMDFSDDLWQLLTNCSDYNQTRNYILMVLQEIQSRNTKPQIILTNSTRINKIASQILYEKGTVPIVDDELILQLLIDAGLEKLSRDYMYILMSANLIDLYEVRQILCNVQTEVFKIESYQKNLMLLSQIHRCLQFTLFAQNHLNCSAESLKKIFTHAFREFGCNGSDMGSVFDLHRNSIQRLEVPLPTIAMEQLVQGLPSSWCLTLSSESTISKICETSYLSRASILPTNIYSLDESYTKEVYYSLKVQSSSTKIAC
ncbi:uncharacterized protein LOC105693044 isoform X1 [Athalia rosae]|uniref:uncharacterized protein LOC105693044 isoform X1 n=1 Tax=Athalia rosae TaxID=37344 RepID=UPI0020345EA5|nr:uncharacterized protein LOC105693044 isoform X1 [Athalia rosae]